MASPALRAPLSFPCVLSSDAFRALSFIRLNWARCAGLGGAWRDGGRGAGGRAEPGAPAKVNFWEAPTDIPKWKDEHIVIAVLAGWGVVIYGAKKAFSS